MNQEEREEQPQEAPAPPEELLRAEMEEASRERDQFRSLAQRIQADFINYRRRMEEERQELQRSANARLILDLLTVVDDFRRALESAPAEGDHASWGEGVEIIYRKLQRVLEREGVTPIEALGKSLDPWEHEALLFQESPDHADGEVIVVVQEGYKLHGKVLRPAQVVVAKRAEAERQASQEKQDIPSEEA
jgi:molecular chaperone GrpE